MKTGQLFADIVRKLADDLGIKIESTKTPFRQSVEENQNRLLAALPDADATTPGQQIDNLGYPGFQSSANLYQVGVTLTLFIGKEAKR